MKGLSARLGRILRDWEQENGELNQPPAPLNLEERVASRRDLRNKVV
jgi:hypothetical protein